MVEKLKSCPFCGGNTCIIQKDNTLREDKRTCTYQIGAPFQEYTLIRLKE